MRSERALMVSSERRGEHRQTAAVALVAVCSAGKKSDGRYGGVKCMEWSVL